MPGDGEACAACSRSRSHIAEARPCSGLERSDTYSCEEESAARPRGRRAACFRSRRLTAEAALNGGVECSDRKYGAERGTRTPRLF